MDQSTSDLASRPFADFPEEEELIIQFWRSCNAFLKSYELSVQEKRTPYVFYDGPPFATVCPSSSPSTCSNPLTFSLGSSSLRSHSRFYHQGTTIPFASSAHDQGHRNSFRTRQWLCCRT